jgi:hypothetical protein
MGFKYRTGDRTFGGSMEGRLNPEFGGTHRIPRTGPDRPRPMVRETSERGCVYENRGGYRRSLIGLPPKFERES